MSTTEIELKKAKNATGRVECSIASTRMEREAAFGLVYRSYLEVELGVPNTSQMRVTPYHLLPTTQVFIARAYGNVTHGEVVSTVSLVIDGELGLPMESIYKQEVDERRSQGLLTAEVTCFADRRRHIRRFLRVFGQLTRVMSQYARKQGVHQLLVAVHPKHARFYTQLLGFEPMGGLTAYPSVRNHPAVALCLDFARIDLEPPKCYDRYFAEALPDDQLQAHPMSADEREHLRRLSEHTLPFIPLGDRTAPSESGDIGLVTPGQ